MRGLVNIVTIWTNIRRNEVKHKLLSTTAQTCKLKRCHLNLSESFPIKPNAKFFLILFLSISSVFRNIVSHLPYTVLFSSVGQSCPTLCNPMNHSTPGLPVHHQLPEFTQTHVHRVGDAIQPSHPLLSPSPPAPNPSQHQSLFQ